MKVSSDFLVNGPLAATMTFSISDMTSMQSVNKTLPAGSLGSAPEKSAEAVLERESDGGGGFYYAVPASAASTNGIFQNIEYDIAYQHDGGTGPYDLIEVDNQPMNTPVGQPGSARCINSDDWCVATNKYNTINDGCDIETGQSPDAMTGGYFWKYKGNPPSSGCEVPN